MYVGYFSYGGCHLTMLRGNGHSVYRFHRQRSLLLHQTQVQRFGVGSCGGSFKYVATDRQLSSRPNNNQLNLRPPQECPTTNPLVPAPLQAKKSSLRPKSNEPFNCHHHSKSPQLQMHPPRQFETKQVHFPS